MHCVMDHGQKLCMQDGVFPSSLYVQHLLRIIDYVQRNVATLQAQ